MNRKDVYLAINAEREYQNKETENADRPDMIEDFNMGTALHAINVILKKADDIWYTESPENNYEGTMNMLRKIAGVCVKMGEKYGMTTRE